MKERPLLRRILKFALCHVLVQFDEKYFSSHLCPTGLCKISVSWKMYLSSRYWYHSLDDMVATSSPSDKAALISEKKFSEDWIASGIWGTGVMDSPVT